MSELKSYTVQLQQHSVRSVKVLNTLITTAVSQLFADYVQNHIVLNNIVVTHARQKVPVITYNLSAQTVMKLILQTSKSVRFY